MSRIMLISMSLLWALIAQAQPLDTLKIKAEADSLLALGDSLHRARMDVRALIDYDLSLKLWQQLGDARRERYVLMKTWVAYTAIGDYQMALEVTKKALKIHQGLGERSAEGAVLNNMGISYIVLGDYPSALRCLQESLVIQRELGDLQGEVRNLGNIGCVYIELCDYQKALECQMKALEITRKVGNKDAESVTLSNIGLVYFNLEDYHKALTYYQEGLSLCRELQWEGNEGETLGNIGRVYCQLSDYPKALHYNKLALDNREKFGDLYGKCRALTNLGEIFIAGKKYDAALEYYQKALKIAQDLKMLSELKGIYFSIGDCYSALNHDSKAIDNYNLAIRIIEEVRTGLEVEAQRTSYAAGTYQIYEGMVLSLLKVDRLSEAYDYVERARARSFLDQLAGGKVKIGKSKHEEFLCRESDYQRQKNEIEEQIASAAADTDKVAILRGKLEDEWSSISALVEEKKRYEPELVSLVTVNSQTLLEVQKLLDKKTTLLEYFLTKEKTLIWLITNDKADVFQIPVGSDSLKELVKGFRDAVLTVGRETYLSRDLYNILIAPVEGKIITPRLVIIPHSVLHYLPFQVLQDPQGNYLLDRYTITNLPSASVMKYLIPKRRSKGDKLLAMGNPKTDRKDFLPLPLAEQEVKEIAEFYPQSQVLIGKEATEDKFRKLAPNYNILHLACHSELNSAYPLYSGLLLAPGVEQDGELDVHELFTMDLNAYLVVLSACQTGLRHLTNGDELVGLSRAFIYAGTASVLSSLWMVEDESTAFLMKQFYQNLKIYDKAESLRRAQLKTREKYPNPYSWAGFVLIGDAQ